jgi:hypothetical protein
MPFVIFIFCRSFSPFAAWLLWLIQVVGALEDQVEALLLEEVV